MHITPMCIFLVYGDDIMILPFRTPKFTIEIPVPHISITLDTPSKGDYYALLTGADMVQILSRYTNAPMTPMIASIVSERYIGQIKRYREDNMDYLVVPSRTDFSAVPDDTPEKLPCLTAAEHLIYEHSGINFIEQNKLPVTEYWTLLADAVKMRILSREDGEDYLEQCYKDMHKISDF